MLFLGTLKKYQQKYQRFFLLSKIYTPPRLSLLLLSLIHIWQKALVADERRFVKDIIRMTQKIRNVKARDVQKKVFALVEGVREFFNVYPFGIVQDILIMKGIEDIHEMRAVAQDAHGLGAVSYTHLDVYKRQV